MSDVEIIRVRSELRDKFVLWGAFPTLCGGVPLQLTGADTTRALHADQRFYQGAGYLCGIYADGVVPEGLKARIRAEWGD